MYRYSTKLTVRLLGAAAACTVLGLVPGCPPAPPPAGRTSTPAAPIVAKGEARWTVYSARRQVSYVKLDLPVVVSGTRITFGRPIQLVAAPAEAAETQPASAPADEGGDRVRGERQSVPATTWDTSALVPYSLRLFRSGAEGPLVDQLTGAPRTSADAGSYLVPLAGAPAAKDDAEGARSYVVAEPMPVYVQVTIPPTADAGTYRVPVTIATPGRAAESALLGVEVADIALPTEPRVLAVATTTTGELARIYPETFGAINGAYLDRANPDHRAAVEQLDGLVKAARARGVALVVEDIVPTMRVDSLGQVTLDWDAYDRLMQPYMDGTAFEDHVPLPVWLAPVPPRRIRDSATQLWQYIDACAKHYAARGWVGAPAFLHPAVANSRAEEEEENTFAPRSDPAALRATMLEMLRLHMPREMLAVATPGAAVPHNQLWSVNDDDPRLPPAGALATESSVRAWPWVCVARDGSSISAARGGGVKGLVWRDALAAAADISNDKVQRPLLVVGKSGEISPTLRLTWLGAGLGDSALLGLLEQRADRNRSGLLGEVLAGIVGRTGLTGAEVSSAGREFPLDEPGYLYAGWPADKGIWNQATPILQKLLLASDPGTRATISPDDPLYLQAKLWLSTNRRPVARIGGYSFSMRTGMESDILDARVHLLVENPVDASAEIDFRFADLPGDFDMPPAPATAPAGTGGAGAADVGIRRRNATLAPSAAGVVTLPLAGHVAALMAAPGATSLEITERHGGAVLPLPVQLPMYRIHGLESGQNPLRLDGQGDDWPGDVQTRVFGEMQVATRYLSRPDLLSGTVSRDAKPATVRWMYDKEYLYLLARCPQDSTSDQRNTDWPLTTIAAETEEASQRWWGTDGLQVVLAPMPATSRAPGSAADAYDRLVKVAFKPAGVVLVASADMPHGPGTLTWRDGPPSGGSGAQNIKYGITINKQDGRVTGYTVEAAIPRAWIDGPDHATVPGTKAPAWRVNVLRHRGSELMSTSWSGPVVDDNDVSMLGALVGE